MAGQHCTGFTVKSGNVRDGKAFCEGMAYRASDVALNVPITDNPHASGRMKEAWDNGWGVADAAAGGTISAANAGCCALIGATVQA